MHGLALLLLVPLGSCRFDKVAIAEGPQRIAVHAILNPAAPDMPILVERVLSGQIDINTDTAFDPSDPILSGKGQPVSGATVTLTNLTTGVTIPALEDAGFIAGGGHGVYRVVNSPPRPGSLVDPTPPPNYMVLASGNTFRLEVVVDGGAEVVTGDVTIPAGFVGPPRPVVTLNRDTDSLTLQWSAIPAAARYAIEVRTPFGPFTLFSDSTAAHLGGGLQNVFVANVPRAFQPGFEQVVSVAAVDQNYYDYFRSNNDPFTGSGLVNHLEGGVGVVGAYVPLVAQTVEVTAAPRGSLDTTYADAGATWTLRLYSESRSGNLTRVTGVAQQGYVRQGVLGTLSGTSLRLAILKDWSAADTAMVVNGTVSGDSLVFGDPGFPAVMRRK